MKGRTKWFRRHRQDPVRTGFYECYCRIAGGAYVIWPEYLMWNGKKFLVPIPMMVIYWRGMTKKAHDALINFEDHGK